MLNQKKLHKTFFLIIDIAAVSILFYLFLKLQYKYFYRVKLDYLPNFLALIKAHYKAYILLIVLWLLIGSYTKQYIGNRNLNFTNNLKAIISQILLFSIFIFTISGIKSEDLLSNLLILGFSFSMFLVLIITRLFIYLSTKKKYSKGENLTNAIIIGENVNSVRLKKILNDQVIYYGIKLVAIDINSDYESILKTIKDNNVKELFISQSGDLNNHLVKSIIAYSEYNHIRINFIPFSLNNEPITLEVEYFDTLPIFKIKKYPLEYLNNIYIKRIFDLTFSVMVTIFLLSWLFPIIALLIKMDSKGDVLFKQKRRGLNGDDFDCYKFRTMKNDGTNSINATVVNDTRITKLGRILRKTSLDELPQFINVIKGEMSVVGPRPHMISQDDHYSEIIQKYNLRNYVKPGITGLAQIKGYRGAIDCDKDMEDRVITDIYYVRNWSITLDMYIIYKTIILVFKGDKNAI